MKLKKRQLDIDYDYSFPLWGIVSDVIEYKLAFWINDYLKINLARQPNQTIALNNHKSLTVLHFLEKTQHVTFRLIKNKLLQPHHQLFLVPELKNVDYFFIMEDDTGNVDPALIYEKLRSVSMIQHVMELEVEKLKSKDNLLF